MTGRYLILTPIESTPDERRFDRSWKRFAELCRSLHRDGLDYEVQLNLTGDRPHILVTASGTAKPRRQSAPRRILVPPPIPPDRCKARADEAAWFLPDYREKRKDGTTYWAKHKDRYTELSTMGEELLQADYEYWRELELLGGQREHYKPGLSVETRSYDDEVAA